MEEVGEINRHLKSRIVARHGTQRVFARAANLPEDLVSRVVHRRYNLTQDERAHWAYVLGTTAERLFKD